ncbi:L7Ae/L30e/S12e/Gadd45 family ribosomal protein [Desulfoscipio geothermicus]|uniref:Ribosomal protein L7Ae n=1 Tax=Desulfoscipio geothermicus DSM 3669 TaxID=1121426 RepID=A0A1I6D8D6_9FIRM|nr:L7Ae/L30e/S12e/Gadd45 family ribosomal protein [Desulfoscipio geothermicus]SFR01709.1 Ribosomal protein L7Ae [Desulfoscipio geothermicus DSM 3669]
MTGVVAQMLGLCRRAGKVISGDTAVRNGFLKDEVKLLILARDASERSKDDFVHLAKEKNVPVFYYASKNELGILLGKAPRTVAAITDEQLARGVAGAMERGEADLSTR